MRNSTNKLIIAVASIFGMSGPAKVQQSASDLAAALASMISVPFTFDYIDNIGADKSGRQLSLTMKPVIPVSLGRGWNMISRTIIPIIAEDNKYPARPEAAGIGDISQS